MPDHTCQCCGVTLHHETRIAIHRCVLCDHCDRLHGDELQIAATKMACAGLITAWEAIGRILVDDAHLAGMLDLRRTSDDPKDNTVFPWIPIQVPRWRVVIGRAIARNEAPCVSLLSQVILAPYLPGRATASVIASIERDFSEALAIVDPNIIGVDVSSQRDVLDPQHLVIKIRATSATPGAVSFSDDDVEIPPDILSRPRGSA